MPRAICWAKITPGRVPSTQMKVSAASASANPIGNPPASVMANPSIIRAPDDGTDAGASPSHTR